MSVSGKWSARVGFLILTGSVLRRAPCHSDSSSVFPSPLLLPVPSPPPLQCSPVHPGRQEHCGRPEAWMWQRPILEQKEEQGSLSRAWHVWPVKPEGQVQEKLGAKGEGRLGEPGRAGSRAWQLPPFWQSWASRQGSGNWHVSPRKPGAHLSGGRREEDSRHWALFALPPPSFAFLSLQSLHSLPFSFLPSTPSALRSLPLSSLSLPGGTLTGRSLVPEIGSGRCLRWHRVLGSPHSAALGMEMRMAWDWGASCSLVPPLGALEGPACSSSTHVLSTTIPSVPGPHVGLLPQRPPSPNPRSLDPLNS